MTFQGWYLTGDRTSMHYWCHGRVLCGAVAEPGDRFKPGTLDGAGRGSPPVVAPHCPTCQKLHLDLWTRNRGKGVIL